MIIALDYDGTYTADPELWDDFIAKARWRGHQVTCVTMRHKHEGAPDVPCDVVFTSRKAKMNAFKADIWIDDNPNWLLNDSI